MSLELRIVEQRVALRQHQAQQALAEGLGVERADLAVGERGHARDVAVDLALLVRHLELLIQPVDVKRHRVQALADHCL